MRLPLVLVFLLLWFTPPSWADDLSLVLQAGHSQAVLDSDWSGNGTLITVGEDGFILEWDLDSGRVVQSMSVEPIYSDSGYRTNGAVAIAGSNFGWWTLHQDGSLSHWNPTSGKVDRTQKLFEGHVGSGAGFLARLSGDLCLAHRSDKELLLVSDGEVVQSFEYETSIKAAAATPDGKKIAVFRSGKIFIQEGQDAPILLEGFASRWGVNSLVFSQDGSELFVGTAVDWVEKWDLNQRTLVSALPVTPQAPTEQTVKGQGYGGEGLGLSVSDFDAHHLVAANRAGTVCLVDKRTLETVNLPAFPYPGLEGLTVAQDPPLVVASFGSGGRGDLMFLKQEDHQWSSHTLDGRADYFMGVDRVGQHLLLVGNGQTVSVDLRSGQKEHNFQTGYFPKWVCGDELFFAGGNEGILRAWNLNTGRQLWENDIGNRGARYGYGILAVALTPDQKTLAVGEYQGRNRVMLLDAVTGELKKEWPTERNVSRLLFSPKGDKLFIATWNGVSLYDLGYSKVLHEWKFPSSQGQTIVGMAMHPDGQHLWALDSKGHLMTADTTQLDKQPTFTRVPNVSQAYQMTRLGDDLLVCGDNLAQVLTSELKIKASYGPHQDFVFGAIPIGNTLVTTSRDYRVQIWDRSTLRLLGTLLSLDRGRDWLLLTESLAFDGSEGAQNVIEWRWNGVNYKVDQFFERFYRPGLLLRLLGDESPGHGLQASSTELGSPPPLLTIEPPNEVADGEFEITVSVHGDLEDWTDLRLYHNGHRVPGGSPFRIRSVEGENNLRASVYNRERTVESEPARLTFVCETPRVPATLFVFAAGINDYPMALDFAVEDAKAFADAFSPGKLFEKVEKVLLLDSQATKEGLTKALTELRCQPQDTLAVFLAGHGAVLDDRFHYIPYGADDTNPAELKRSSLSSTELGEILASIPATKQVLFLDTCHAGASAKDLAGLLVDRKAPLISSPEGASLIRDQKLLARQTGTFLVAGSSPQSTAAEFPELGHGVFTYAVLKGLEEGESQGQNQEITVNALLRYLSQAVPDLSAKFRGSRQDVWQFSAGQDFPLSAP